MEETKRQAFLRGMKAWKNAFNMYTATRPPAIASTESQAGDYLLLRYYSGKLLLRSASQDGEL